MGIFSLLKDAGLAEAKVLSTKGPTTVRSIQLEFCDTQFRAHRTKSWQRTSMSLESRTMATNLIPTAGL
jgi:hypothetical protein